MISYYCLKHSTEFVALGLIVKMNTINTKIMRCSDSCCATRKKSESIEKKRGEEEEEEKNDGQLAVNIYSAFFCLCEEENIIFIRRNDMQIVFVLVRRHRKYD